MVETVNIGNRRIGKGQPVYIVAELSCNHLQNFETAAAILRAAKEAGADAVKLQTYRPDTITLNCRNEHFQLKEGNTWAGQTLYELYEKAATPWEWQPRLKKMAEDLGLDCFSSPFDFSAVDFLETLEVKAYKIASFELVDLPLLEYVASKGKPVILSTGLGNLSEIEEAVQAIRKTGNEQIVLLRCASAYPADPSTMHLKNLVDLHQRFHLPTGLSDHTLGDAMAVAAVALGACFIEKHLTLRRADGGPDASFSMEPDEFRKMVQNIRAVEAATAAVHYDPSPSEKKNLIFRRSLFVVRDVKAGEKVTAENVRSIRPGNGLHTRHYGEVLGKTFGTDLPMGTPLCFKHLREFS